MRVGCAGFVSCLMETSIQTGYESCKTKLLQDASSCCNIRFVQKTYHKYHGASMDGELMSTSMAARLLGLSPDAVRYHERCGNLLALKLDKQRLFLRRDVERFHRQRAERSRRGNTEDG